MVQTGGASTASQSGGSTSDGDGRARLFTNRCKPSSPQSLARDPKADRLADDARALHVKANAIYQREPARVYECVVIEASRRAVDAQMKRVNRSKEPQVATNPPPPKPWLPGESMHDYGYAVVLDEREDVARLERAMVEAGWRVVRDPEQPRRYEAVGAPGYAEALKRREALKPQVLKLREREAALDAVIKQITDERAYPPELAKDYKTVEMKRSFFHKELDAYSRDLKALQAQPEGDAKRLAMRKIEARRVALMREAEVFKARDQKIQAYFGPKEALFKRLNAQALRLQGERNAQVKVIARLLGEPEQTRP